MGRPIRKRQATTRTAAIGAVVTELRLKKGLGYQAVADRVGIDYDYLQKLEMGKAPNPTIGVLQALADFHRIKLSRLIAMAEDKYARRKRPKNKLAP
jgi:transcriptional regulator with XRE-family HTH domain